MLPPRRCGSGWAGRWVRRPVLPSASQWGFGGSPARSASRSSRRYSRSPKSLFCRCSSYGSASANRRATIALGVFFPTTIATYSGVDSVPRTLIRMAQSFDLPFAAIVRKIVIPAALPSILSGFRISASIALLLVVSAEMIGADRGIGAFVLQAGNLMQTDQLLAGVVVLSVFGLVVARLIGFLEARLLAWR